MMPRHHLELITKDQQLNFSFEIAMTWPDNCSGQVARGEVSSIGCLYVRSRATLLATRDGGRTWRRLRPIFRPSR
jgi:hypothetical protein